MNRNWSFALGVGLSVLAACRDTAGPSAETRAAAGIYVLQPSDQSYAPKSGAIYLMPSGKAERHVTYQFDTQPVHEDVSKGTYRVEGSMLYLELIVEASDFTYTWRLTGTIDGPTLTFRYPGPADGEITETYHR